MTILVTSREAGCDVAPHHRVKVRDGRQTPARRAPADEGPDVVAVVPGARAVYRGGGVPASRFSRAAFVAAALEAGVDLADPDEAERFIARYNLGWPRSGVLCWVGGRPAGLEDAGPAAARAGDCARLTARRRLIGSPRTEHCASCSSAMVCPYSQELYNWGTAGQGYAQFAGLLAGFSLAAMILMADRGPFGRSAASGHGARASTAHDTPVTFSNPADTGDAAETTGLQRDTQRSLSAGLMALILAALLYSNAASEATQQSSGRAPPLILLASLVLVIGVFAVLHGLVLLLLQGEPRGVARMIGIIAWGAPTVATALIGLLTHRVMEWSGCKTLGAGSAQTLFVLAVVLVVSAGTAVYLVRGHVASHRVLKVGLVLATFSIFALTLLTGLVGEFRWQMPTLLILSAPVFTAIATVVYAVDVKRCLAAALQSIDAHVWPVSRRTYRASMRGPLKRSERINQHRDGRRDSRPVTAGGRAAAPPGGLHPRLGCLERRALPGGLALLVARDRGSRRHGLARLDAPPAGAGLLLERCRSVHTLGMRFALDLLWLDGAGTLVRLDRAVAPRRLRTCLQARAVVEVAAGEGERFARALAAASCRFAPG